MEKHLGALLLAVVTVTAPSRALAQSPHIPRVGGPPTEGVAVCAGSPGDPLRECGSVPRLPLDSGAARDGLAAAPMLVEERIQRALDNQIRSDRHGRSFGPEPVLHYGLEIEPQGQYQLRRELIALAAKLIELPPGVRASIMPRPLSSVRSIRESQELERSSQRATFLQVEEFKGPSPIPATMATEVAYGGAGVALFAAGGLAARVFRASLSDRFRVQPQPWPPGLQINGRFD